MSSQPYPQYPQQLPPQPPQYPQYPQNEPQQKPQIKQSPKSSKKKYVIISFIAVFFLILIIAFIVFPSSINPFSDDSYPRDIEIKLSFEDTWQGAIATQINGEQKVISFNGSGTEVYNYELDKGDIISASMLSLDNVTGTMKITIYDNGKKVEEVYTNQYPYMLAAKYEVE